MSRQGPVGAPRHLAGTKRADRLPEPSGAAWAATPAHLAADDPEPLGRVHRSRLAIAVSVTLAAIPVLLLDNFPATADTGHDRTEVEVAAADEPVDEDAAAPTITIQPLTESTPSTAAADDPVAADAPAEPAPERDEPAAAPQVQALRSPSEPAPTRPAPAPTTTTAPPAPTTTAAPPAASSSPGDPNDPATWDRLAQCESGGRWNLNSGNGYYGGLQFSLASWRDVGGVGYPHEASRDEQIKRGKMLQARYGWGQWPHCSRELGYR